MQALLLRLRTQLWIGSGHGFNTLSDALLGIRGEISSKAQRESVELRVARAACLRDVCAQDVGKGLQLLEGIEVDWQNTKHACCCRSHLSLSCRLYLGIHSRVFDHLRSVTV